MAVLYNSFIIVYNTSSAKMTAYTIKHFKAVIMRPSVGSFACALVADGDHPKTTSFNSPYRRKVSLVRFLLLTLRLDFAPLCSVLFPTFILRTNETALRYVNHG